MTYEIWRHRRTGERFAVAIDGTNELVTLAAIGPITLAAAPDFLAGNWDRDWDEAATEDILLFPEDYEPDLFAMGEKP